MATKLYVGNLSQDSTEQQLRDLFSQAGEISNVAVISDQATGLNRGFGFIEMESDEAAQDAIQRFNGFALNSNDLVVNVARPRADRPGGGPRR
jgi:RNA recognition motif-containing protein